MPRDAVTGSGFEMTTADLSLDLTRGIVTEAPMADQQADTPSGWWIVPLTLSGAGVWIGLFLLIF